jgi:pimeloyl-ACP methyl ester carboxylesterase
MRLKPLVIGLLTIAAVGAGWRFYYNREKADERQAAADLAGALAAADRLGNCVVNARDAGKKPDTLAVVARGESHPVPARGPAVPLGDAAVCVVFVHGYNVPFASGVTEGNELCDELARQLGADGFQTIRFFSFCWRGDNGVLNFDESNASALRTAPALARFLTGLAQDPPPAGPRRLIVVTHSLGALLALEALRTAATSPDGPLVDTLLLVQPAVKVDLLGRATIKQIVSVPPRGRTDPNIPEFVVLPEYENNGVYFDTIARATRQTLVTASSQDSVLSWVFDGIWAKGVQGARVSTWPISRFALGTLVKDRAKGWTFPGNLEVFDLTPSRAQPTGVHGHSDVFDPRNEALRQFLIEEIRRHPPPVLPGVPQ